tara:strand:- start:801 stop:1484 length:684 start_codon:yes stop_codon:yes gene_type:complete
MKMKSKLLEHNGLKFYAREGTSDEKTFNEVIVNKTYEKKYFGIKENEKWLDLGGNVGAFALTVLSKGAKVEIYEPDPFSCRMIEKNLKVNNFDANIIQKAVVGNHKKKMTMFVGNDMQVWRNSLYRNWGNQKFSVDCIHFSEVINNNHCCKMDIEGAEIDILENMNIFPKKLVFEWTFQVDKNLNRYRRIVEKMKANYENVKYYSYSQDYVEFQPNWFPKCTNVFNY